MNAEFFKSWKGAFLVAGLVIASMSAYKLAFGPDAETRIAETRMRNSFPNGRPTEEILDRPVVVGLVRENAGYSLRDLIDYLEASGELDFEPLELGSFIMRYYEQDRVTLLEYDIAVQFWAVDGPSDFEPGYAAFEGKAVSAERVSVNNVELAAAQKVLLLVNLRAPIAALQ